MLRGELTPRRRTARPLHGLSARPPMAAALELVTCLVPPAGPSACAVVPSQLLWLWLVTKLVLLRLLHCCCIAAAAAGSAGEPTSRAVELFNASLRFATHSSYFLWLCAPAPHSCDLIFVIDPSGWPRAARSACFACWIVVRPLCVLYRVCGMRGSSAGLVWVRTGNLVVPGVRSTNVVRCAVPRVVFRSYDREAGGVPCARAHLYFA